MYIRQRTILSRIRLAIRMLVLAALLVFFCTSQKARAVKLLAPTWFGLEPIATGVYVDKATPAGQREQILAMVAQAREQLARYYGDVTTAPEFFFCSSEACFQSFGGTTQGGMTYGHYASLLSPRGRSMPIVAHEWSHAEFNSRLGFWAWLHTPQWFDDGLAVTVSEEPRHSESVYQEALQAGASPPPLSELESMRQWSRAVRKYRDPKLNPGNRALVYATAGHEVRSWFQQARTPGLLKFCAEMRSGANFPDANADTKRQQPSPSPPTPVLPGTTSL
jgi:hypothetical protein